MDHDAIPPGSLGTLRNAALILDLLSTGPAYQQLSELAERSNLTTPTVHRLLRSLLLAGLVKQDPISCRYSLGPQLVRLSECYLMRLPVVQALAPYLIQLRDATKATVQVAVLIDSSIIYIDRVDGENVDGIYRVSHRMYSALETAAGRVLLARTDPALLKEVINKATTEGLAFADFPLEDPEVWGQSPYLAHSDPYLPELLEVAVPVLDQRNHVLAALSLTARHEFFTEEVVRGRIVPQLQRVATMVKQATHHL
jgi:IclR family transcriptional regulator, acetate operon repressor